MQREDSTYG